MQAELLVNTIRSGQLYGQHLTGEISKIVNDTRELVQDCVFVAIKGETFDGHVAVQEVAKAKAKLMVVEYLPENWEDYELTYMVVPSTYRAQAVLANAFYQKPSEQLNVIAVTGTNGKTTISTMISELLMHKKRKTGVIGTLHYKVDQTFYSAPNTTPNAVLLQSLFAEMVNAGCQDAVIEASSHALALGRLSYTDIDCAIFTNLTREHLDFHVTMDHYAYAKSLLFAQLGQQFHQGKPRIGVVNLDDPYAEVMIQATSAEILTYSLQHENATLYASNMQQAIGGQTFDVTHRGTTINVFLPMLGDYNVANFLAVALCLMYYYEWSLVEVVQAVREFKGVEGRMEVIRQGQLFEVIVDFAHTPDAVARVLSAARKTAKKRLVTIIGHSGGNRDSGARPEIGDYVFQYSDYIIFTADNPRHESVTKICAELIGSHQEVPYEIIEDRVAAVNRAIDLAQEGDMLVFAGKGGEPYQIIADEKVPYSEAQVIRQALTTHGY